MKRTLIISFKYVLFLMLFTYLSSCGQIQDNKAVKDITPDLYLIKLIDFTGHNASYNKRMFN